MEQVTVDIILMVSVVKKINDKFACACKAVIMIKKAWKSCFVHMVEVQGHFESRGREFKWRIDSSGFCLPEFGVLGADLLSS